MRKKSVSRRCLKRRAIILLACTVLCLLILIPVCVAAEGVPDVTDGENSSIFPFNLISDLLEDTAVDDATNTVELILLLTVLTLVPSILVMMTSFTRIVIILSFTRNAIGTQSMPPNQVVIGLALFLTYFTMIGPITQIIENAWEPYQAEEIGAAEAFGRAVTPLREFMLDQILLQEHQGDLAQFMELAGVEQPATWEQVDEIPTYVIIPAFITSEIKTAFRIGFVIFMIFIVVDMVVSSALMSMGMMMLPPVMISLPFKIMLFVLLDGWNLVVQLIITTFTG
ncbi:MAG: flagellar type III secretion system pore protein FliP [Oscillospiraceae bacterium]|jgi:flagellar biosynthetic protein FliP|nr:flagellar type III secretion system pore protein FliP [Oscillospiraceae bacterium]